MSKINFMPNDSLLRARNFGKHAHLIARANENIRAGQRVAIGLRFGGDVHVLIVPPGYLIENYGTDYVHLRTPQGALVIYRPRG